MKTVIPLIIRIIMVLVMLYFIYDETGPVTTISIGLIFIFTELQNKLTALQLESTESTAIALERLARLAKGK